MRNYKESLWDDKLKALKISTAKLLSGSSFDVGRRIYVSKDSCYKIVINKYDLTADSRENNLAEEFKILKKLEDESFTPDEVKIIEKPDFQTHSNKYY